MGVFALPIDLHQGGGALGVFAPLPLPRGENCVLNFGERAHCVYFGLGARARARARDWARTGARTGAGRGVCDIKLPEHESAARAKARTVFLWDGRGERANENVIALLL